MIITKTPFRMSFFGGGTDIPEYFYEHKGAVISTTFDKYCYGAPFAKIFWLQDTSDIFKNGIC